MKVRIGLFCGGTDLPFSSTKPVLITFHLEK